MAPMHLRLKLPFFNYIGKADSRFPSSGWRKKPAPEPAVIREAPIHPHDRIDGALTDNKATGMPVRVVYKSDAGMGLQSTCVQMRCEVKFTAAGGVFQTAAKRYLKPHELCIVCAGQKSLLVKEQKGLACLWGKDEEEAATPYHLLMGFLKHVVQKGSHSLALLAMHPKCKEGLSVTNVLGKMYEQSTDVEISVWAGGYNIPYATKNGNIKNMTLKYRQWTVACHGSPVWQIWKAAAPMGCGFVRSFVGVDTNAYGWLSNIG